MRPAWSIIVFTAFSGAGLGTAAILPWLALSSANNIAAATLALALLSGGLLASTGHLANPKNAWRAFFRWRTSWLSREAVLAVLFYPLFGCWLWAALSGWHKTATALAAAVFIMAIAVVFCTAMIYASLKTVPVWRRALTPANYLALATSGGALTLAAVAPSPGVATLAGMALAWAAAGKATHFVRVAALPPASSATALQAPQIRLLEAGHGADNFLTREFTYTPPAGARALAWRLWWWLGVVAPLACLAAYFLADWSLPLVAAAVAHLAGVLAERWLFFAEARHVLRVYYDK